MIQAIKDTVIVKPMKPRDSEGNIFIPSAHRKTESLGHVVSVGNEIKTLKPNDFVFFTLHGGKRFHYQNEEYIRFKDHEVYAVIEQS